MYDCHPSKWALSESECALLASKIPSHLPCTLASLLVLPPPLQNIRCTGSRKGLRKTEKQHSAHRILETLLGTDASSRKQHRKVQRQSVDMPLGFHNQSTVVILQMWRWLLVDTGSFQHLKNFAQGSRMKDISFRVVEGEETLEFHDMSSPCEGWYVSLTNCTR